MPVGRRGEAVSTDPHSAAMTAAREACLALEIAQRFIDRALVCVQQRC